MEPVDNYGRKVAAAAFEETLNHMFGRPELSEAHFRDEWLARILRDTRMYKAGWFAPPPEGVAILSGPAKYRSRTTFKSLREESTFPGPTHIDWDAGILYAYASPVDRETGRPGDFAITLYFGQDPIVREHFRNCRQAVTEVVAGLRADGTSDELFRSSEKVFTRQGLFNSIVGFYDPTRRDIGHSLPQLVHAALGQVPWHAHAIQENLRTNRKFIAPGEKWLLGSETQITIEPRLVSTRNSKLPQVNIHLVAHYADGQYTVLDDGQALLEQYGLLS